MDCHKLFKIKNKAFITNIVSQFVQTIRVDAIEANFQYLNATSFSIGTLNISNSVMENLTITNNLTGNIQNIDFEYNIDENEILNKIQTFLTSHNFDIYNIDKTFTQLFIPPQ